MTKEASKAKDRQSVGTVTDAGTEKTVTTFKYLPGADGNISNQRRSIIRKIEAAKKKDKNSGQLSFIPDLTKAEANIIHTETLDHYISLSKIPAEARAVHKYFKSLFITEHVEPIGEKFSKITINAHGDMYDVFTKKAYSKTNSAEHRDYHRKLLRWTETLTEHAHVKFRTGNGTSGISGNIYPRIELDAKNGKLEVYVMREYADENKAHGIDYDIPREALFIMANGTHAGALAYDYLSTYYNNRYNRKNADGTLKKKVTMKTLMDNCGVQNLDEAKTNRHQTRDVKEPIINGLAEYRKAKVIDYILTLNGQTITDAEAILLNDDDFKNICIEKIAFPIPVRKLGKKPDTKPEATQTEMDFGVTFIDAPPPDDETAPE